MLVWKKRHLREEMPFFAYVPILSFLSVFSYFSSNVIFKLFLSFCRRFRIFLFTFVPVNHKRIIYVEITFKALVVAAAP